MQCSAALVNHKLWRHSCQQSVLLLLRVCMHATVSMCTRSHLISSARSYCTLQKVSTLQDGYMRTEAYNLG